MPYPISYIQASNVRRGSECALFGQLSIEHRALPFWLS